MIELRAKIAGELQKIQELVVRANNLLSLVQEVNDTNYRDGLVSGLALYLQNFYTGIERVFSLIAKEIDGVLPSTSDWHIQLLGQMLVEIPDIRPAVISQKTYESLNEFRGFRHVVRNLYAYDLNHHRVIELANQLRSCSQSFVEDINKFNLFLSDK